MTAFALTARQKAAQHTLGSAATNVMLAGGSRSGKTFLILRAIALRALAAPHSRHAVFRLAFNHCKTSIVHDTWPKMLRLCFPQVAGRLDKTDWYYEFPNGAQVWFGGLDDKDRTEKILGQEYATLYLNEASQISFAARNLALTRLAQRCEYVLDGQPAKPLRLKAFYDCNPPSKAHWLYQVFVALRDPDSRAPLHPDDYAVDYLNPADNAENLPPEYLRTLDGLPARMRARFLEGKFTDAASNALWTLETLDRWRAEQPPEMQRVIVAVDPSGTAGESDSGDAVGIAVCGLGTDGHGYLLEDLTLKAGPASWGKVAVSAFERHGADRIVAERNFGGEMVRHVIQTARANVPVRLVTASRGKTPRADPVAALHEQGKIRLAGRFPQLEDELCAFTTTGYAGERSPNRADAFVWGMSELFPFLIKPEPAKPKEPYHSYARRHGGATGWMGG